MSVRIPLFSCSGYITLLSMLDRIDLLDRFFEKSFHIVAEVRGVEWGQLPSVKKVSVQY